MHKEYKDGELNKLILDALKQKNYTVIDITQEIGHYDYRIVANEVSKLKRKGLVGIRSSGKRYRLNPPDGPATLYHHYYITEKGDRHDPMSAVNKRNKDFAKKLKKRRETISRRVERAISNSDEFQAIAEKAGRAYAREHKIVLDKRLPGSHTTNTKTETTEEFKTISKKATKLETELAKLKEANKKLKLEAKEYKKKRDRDEYALTKKVDKKLGHVTGKEFEKQIKTQKTSADRIKHRLSVAKHYYNDYLNAAFLKDWGGGLRLVRIASPNDSVTVEFVGGGNSDLKRKGHMLPIANAELSRYKLYITKITQKSITIASKHENVRVINKTIRI